MKNCLVTKLNSAVNNDSLMYLGGIVVHFSGTTLENRTLSLVGESVERAIIINDAGNTYFTNLDGSANYGKEATSNSGFITISGSIAKLLILSGNAECDVVVFSKYKMTNFNANNNAIVPKDLQWFAYSTETGGTLRLYYNNNNAGVDLGENYFKNAKIQNLYITGSVSMRQIISIPYIQNKNLLKVINFVRQSISNEVFEQICEITSLTSLTINTSQAISDIDVSKLSNLINLTTISILDIITNFGPIETFVANQRSKGRTTCDGINWKYAGYINATFNGNAVAKDEAVRILSWTATTITFDGVTINA